MERQGLCCDLQWTGRRVWSISAILVTIGDEVALCVNANFKRVFLYNFPGDSRSFLSRQGEASTIFSCASRRERGTLEVQYVVTTGRSRRGWGQHNWYANFASGMRLSVEYIVGLMRDDKYTYFFQLHTLLERR